MFRLYCRSNLFHYFNDTEKLLQKLIHYLFIIHIKLKNSDYIIFLIILIYSNMFFIVINILFCMINYLNVYKFSYAKSKYLFLYYFISFL